MKKSIKIITILGIVTSFFPVYSMEDIRSICYPVNKDDLKNRRLFVCEDDLKKINPLSGTDKLPIYHEMVLLPIESSGLLRITEECLFTKLAAIRLLEGLDSENNDEILKTICTAVSRETPIVSWPCEFVGTSGTLISLDSDPSSIFEDIKNWFYQSLLIKYIEAGHVLNAIFSSNQSSSNQWQGDADVNVACDAVTRREMMNHPIYNPLMNALFRGEDERQERSWRAYIHDKLKINISIDLVNLIHSFSLDDKKRIKLFTKAKEEFLFVKAQQKLYEGR